MIYILTLYKPDSSNRYHEDGWASSEFEQLTYEESSIPVEHIAKPLAQKLKYWETGYTAYVKCIANGTIYFLEAYVSDSTGKVEFNTDNEEIFKELISKIRETVEQMIREREEKERKEEESKKNLENRRIAAQEKAEFERLRKKYEGLL